MVNNTVNATYVETYDLNTALGELTLLGIHTPQAKSLKTMYKGFFENYKKFKIHSCDIAMVCASTQNLTPDLVGMEAGAVDPRDVLNPILFKACTGETIDILSDQIYDSNTADVRDGSIEAHYKGTSATTTEMATLGAYYEFMADDSWRKSHPQSGLIVRNLKPYVHRVVTTQPFRYTGNAATGSSVNRQVTARPAIYGANDQNSTSNPVGFGSPSGESLRPNPTVFVSNGLADMPWMDTTTENSEFLYAPDGTQKETAVNTIGVINDIPKVWMGAIILPPAILQRLFFRLQIRWHVSFRDFRPAFEVGPLNRYGNNRLEPTGMSNPYSTESSFSNTYFELYHSATSLKQPKSSFDATGTAEITEVNEKAM